MDIKIIYYQNNEEKENEFSGYAELGFWMSNNYSEIEIKDIITSED